MTAAAVAAQLWLLLAALGLNLAVGHAGLPVLGQGAFVAVGGYGVLLLGPRAGLPLGLAVVAAVLGAAALGLVVGFGSARLHGPYLALGTWALAWLAAAVLAAFPSVFGTAQGLVHEVPFAVESRVLGLRWALTPAVLAVIAALLCAAVAVATWWLRRSPLGLDLAALRDSPTAAAAVGVRVAGLRRGSFAAAAAIGAAAGAGAAVTSGVVAPSDVSPLLSVQLFVAVLLGGTASVAGPVAGVAVLGALPTVADRLATATGLAPERSRGVVTAALLVAVLVARDPLLRRLRRGSRSRPARVSVPEPASPVVTRPDPAEVLVANGLTLSFGALRALDGVDLVLRPGEVHALVGPNGSGKTTLLRVLAGALRPDAGTVRVCGRDVTAAGEAERVRAGVARTFQRTVLFPGLDVLRHAAAGARATEPHAAWRIVLATPRARAAHAAATRRAVGALHVTGLADRAGARPEELDHADQRLLQVARAAATGARVLLLDEPAAGMSPDGGRRLAAAVRELAGNGAAVLLVEHDMRLVAALADRVTVLAEGRVLASGTPDDVRREPAVRRAYLGDGEVA